MIVWCLICTVLVCGLIYAAHTADQDAEGGQR